MKNFHHPNDLSQGDFFAGIGQNDDWDGTDDNTGKKGGFPYRRMKRRPGGQPVLKPPSAFSSSPGTDEDRRRNGTFSFFGILELHPKGFGFLRIPKINCIRLLSDPFVPNDVIKRYNLREGVLICGAIHPDYEGHGPRLMEIIDVEGLAPDDYAQVKPFDQTIPAPPEDLYRLETGAEPISTRVMDILTPLGKGQRGLIVAPPQTGKTVLIQQICSAIAMNYPQTHIIAFFLDERPEDVNDFRLSVKAEVISSRSTELENQIRLAQLVRERCHRLVEVKKDVLLLIDSITSLTRSIHQWTCNDGPMRPAHIHMDALQISHDMFSQARVNKEGGSLTIIGTLLVDTGNPMDDLIYQGFMGVGNMQVVLDRELADNCVWPAINVFQSGTRNEENLLPTEAVRVARHLRRAFKLRSPIDIMEVLCDQIADYESNAELFDKLIKNNHEWDFPFKIFR